MSRVRKSSGYSCFEISLAILDNTMRIHSLLLALLFALLTTTAAFGAVSDPPAPSDPTKPATAVWIDGSWIVDGNARTWQPAHWDVQQNGRSVPTPTSVVTVAPAPTIVYVQSAPAYEPTHEYIYTQPAAPNRVSIFGGFTGACYGVEVYQPQCHSNDSYNRPVIYRNACQPSSGCNSYSTYRPYGTSLVLHKPGRG
jgi:hypothetical protein